MIPDIDLEVGQVPRATPPVLREEEVGRSKTHEKMATLQPHNSSDASIALPVLTGQEEHPAVSKPFTSTCSRSNIDTPQRNVNGVTNDQSTRAGQGPSQAEGRSPTANNPTAESAPRNTTSDAESQRKREEPRMIGDFDASASEFWKLFKDEAKSHDDARIYSLKEDMESALIFAGLFSAALTGFVLDSKQDLQVKPADETVYYLRQHSTILSQISVQLASIAPQVSVPSTPPAPFPAFSPSTSDVRVNAFWFMALAFSLVAALLAILVQKWVRDYMHVFNRYSDPLKSARLRQYLYEGCEGWYMPMVAEAIPGFLHISLFLFFIGLGDSLLNINTTVGISTIVPIGVCGLLYILTSFLAIISPQSPYHNSFSGIVWFLFQKLRVWKYRDQGHDGELKPVDTNVAQGRMQLAMDETEARMGRDVEAIRWLIDNMTEGAEMERLLLAIPGSFNTDWGMEVWSEVGKCKQDESDDGGQDEPTQAVGPPMDTIVLTAQATRPVNRSSYFRRIHSVFRPITQLVNKLIPHHSATSATTYPPVPYPPNAHANSATAHIQGDVVRELSERINRSFVICKNPGLLEEESWRKRTRACVETTALLVCCINAEFGWFGDIVEVLGNIGANEKIRELSLAGRDQSFVMRWTCLSLIAIRPILENDNVRRGARHAVNSIAMKDDNGNCEALAGARNIDGNLQNASECLSRLYDALCEEEDLTERVKEILSGCESEISELERLNVKVNNMKIQNIDWWISMLQWTIAGYSHRITSQIPGVLDDSDESGGDDAPLSFSRFVELSSHEPQKRQFTRPERALKSMCFPALTLRKTLGGQGSADEYKELIQNLKKFQSSFGRRSNEMQRLLSRMQDLVDGGGLGFVVELFFLAFKQRFSESSSEKSHSVLYTGTFRTITSDWNKHKHSLGTQRLLLDIAWSHFLEFSFFYPVYIVDEFVSLLSKIFGGQTGPHIDEAVERLECRSVSHDERMFRERMLKALTGAHAQPS